MLRETFIFIVNFFIDSKNNIVNDNEIFIKKIILFPFEVIEYQITVYTAEERKDDKKGEETNEQKKEETQKDDKKGRKDKKVV